MGRSSACDRARHVPVYLATDSSRGGSGFEAVVPDNACAEVEVGYIAFRLFEINGVAKIQNV
jgi:hypothetical protein